MIKSITQEDLDNENYIPDAIFMEDREISILNIKWLDNSNILKIKIKNIEKSIIYLPKYNDKESHIENISPQVFMYKFENFYTRIDSSNFHNKTDIIIERIENIDTDYCNYRSGNLVLHGNNKAVIRNPKNHTIIEENCLFLGGNGSFNYYHWLIEIAPKILLLNQKLISDNKIQTIAVNSLSLEIPQFKEILDIFTKRLNFKIKYYQSDQILFFKNLYHINNSNNILFNSKKQLSSPNHCNLSRQLLDEIREKMLNEKTEILNSPRKIFLLRDHKKLSKHNKRNYNEKEIYNFFKNQGFVGIFVEDYSFREQVYLFNNADFIVGPTGAFWANTIFCKKNTLAISWLNNNMKDFSLFSTLAKYFDCNMFFLKSTEKNENHLHGEYHLDLDKIINLFNKITNQNL